MTVEPTINLRSAIEQRRAVRSFRSDPIPAVIFEQILRLGMQAPSGFNLQPWRFVVVRELENQEKLRACAFDQRQVTEAPAVLICCGDRRVNQSDYIESVIDLARENDALTDKYAEHLRSAIPNLFEKQPSFNAMEAWTNRHTMIAVAHMMIIAKSFGVDSCPMEGFVAEQVKEAFKIPAEVDVCCLLALGYAGEPDKAYGGRFEVERVCYAEEFGEPFKF